MVCSSEIGSLESNDQTMSRTAGATAAGSLAVLATSVMYEKCYAMPVT
jgi:hypothetical protein